MHYQAFQRLTESAPKARTISVSNLTYLDDRTLLWGYTTDRQSWHVYLLYGEIYHLCYEYPRSSAIINNDKFLKYNFLINKKQTSYDLDQHHLVPNKRLYPEACDFEFCSLLKEQGIHLPFTNFNHDRPTQQFYGLTIDHLKNETIYDPYEKVLSPS